MRTSGLEPGARVRIEASRRIELELIPRARPGFGKRRKISVFLTLERNGYFAALEKDVDGLRRRRPDPEMNAIGGDHFSADPQAPPFEERVAVFGAGVGRR